MTTEELKKKWCGFYQTLVTMEKDFNQQEFHELYRTLFVRNCRDRIGINSDINVIDKLSLLNRQNLPIGPYYVDSTVYNIIQTFYITVFPFQLTPEDKISFLLTLKQLSCDPLPTQHYLTRANLKFHRIKR
eukprot:GHVR01150012.1.p1 GENE.GHVR01150012.1~~GHVR01150012.1.p1  ORF type:complete len:131 (-),score=1.29 GHVR01150012.1:117-509(-)